MGVRVYLTRNYFRLRAALARGLIRLLTMDLRGVILSVLRRWAFAHDGVGRYGRGNTGRYRRLDK